MVRRFAQERKENATPIYERRRRAHRELITKRDGFVSGSGLILNDQPVMLWPGMDWDRLLNGIAVTV